MNGWKRITLAALITVTLAAGIVLAADPGMYSIMMQAGEDYRLQLKLSDSSGAPVNITGNSYAAQFRAAPAPSGAVFANLSTSITDAVNGQISIRLSRAQTTALSGKSGVWDLRQTSGGLNSYVLSGNCAVRPTVTR